MHKLETMKLSHRILGFATASAMAISLMGVAAVAPAYAEEAIASGASLPAGYSITANGADLTVTGPEGSELYLYILDDATFQANGQTFNGIVSNDGVWTEYLPDAR